MSWNPRRFAIAAAERPATRDAVAMWLTSAAVTRLASALLHETLDFSTAPPFPAEGVVLGLECPLGTAAGERAAMVYTRVEGLPAADGPMHTDKVMATPTVANLGRLENPQEWADFLGHSSHGISHIAMDRRGVTIDTQLEVIFQSPSGDAISLSDGTSALCGLFADGFGEGKWLRDGLTPAERALIRFCAHAAWVLLHEPVEREVSAITLSPTPIRTGKGRRGRDMSVSVIDVRRSTTTRSAPSGRVIEHDHRWTPDERQNLCFHNRIQTAVTPRVRTSARYWTASALRESPTSACRSPQRCDPPSPCSSTHPKGHRNAERLALLVQPG